MYILIFENGEVKQADNICDGDLRSSDADMLTIIDITDAMPTEYHDGKWHPLDDI